jgi:long-subunit acyl-CoA synthetase (AMP-forming)
MQVPLYDTLGADTIEFVIKHSNIRIIFCSTNKLKALATVLPKVKESVSEVIVWSSLPGFYIDEQLLVVRLAFSPDVPLHMELNNTAVHM